MKTEVNAQVETQPMNRKSLSLQTHSLKSTIILFIFCSLLIAVTASGAEKPSLSSKAQSELEAIEKGIPMGLPRKKATPQVAAPPRSEEIATVIIADRGDVLRPESIPLQLGVGFMNYAPVGRFETEGAPVFAYQNLAPTIMPQVFARARAFGFWQLDLFLGGRAGYAQQKYNFPGASTNLSARLDSLLFDMHARLELAGVYPKFLSDRIDVAAEAAIGRLEMAHSGSSSLLTQSAFLTFSALRAELAIRVYSNLRLFLAGERKRVLNRLSSKIDLNSDSTLVGLRWRI